jgi:hypothetical protein
MEKCFAHRKAGKVLAAATAAAGLAAVSASQADASLIIDVRATSVNGVPVVDNKSAAVVGNGDVVTMAVFAQVGGTNNVNDETVSIVGGSYNSVGGLLGNLSAVVVSPFTQSGYVNGNQSDFDSDGDLDVGSTGTTATNKMAGRASPPGATPPTVLNSNSAEIQLATLTFTVTGGSGSAAVNFIPRSNSTGADWNEDGVATFQNPTVASFTAGSPVSVTAGIIPEPASIGLLGIAGLGLLARRRDKKA